MPRNACQLRSPSASSTPVNREVRLAVRLELNDDAALTSPLSSLASAPPAKQEHKQHACSQEGDGGTARKRRGGYCQEAPQGGEQDESQAQEWLLVLNIVLAIIVAAIYVSFG